MKPFVVTLGFVVVTSFWLAGCGGQNEQPADRPPAASSPPGSETTQALDITFKSEPDPPKMGENSFEVMVMDSGAKPVTDADVSVALYMAAMPSMNMPEMRSNVSLTHEGNGRYRGTGSVAMAGAWETTVMVMRGGREVGTRKLTITAK